MALVAPSQQKEVAPIRSRPLRKRLLPYGRDPSRGVVFSSTLSQQKEVAPIRSRQKEVAPIRSRPSTGWLLHFFFFFFFFIFVILQFDLNILSVQMVQFKALNICRLHPTTICLSGDGKGVFGLAMGGVEMCFSIL